MISKWAQRFYENIDPCPGEMGFDGLGNLETKTENKVKINNECSKEDKECMRLGFRMDELKDRISHHAGSPATLSWNKNVQCPPKTWDGLLSKEGRVIYKECKADSHKWICVKWYNTQTYTFVFCFCEEPKSTDWKPNEDPNRRAWESTGNQKSLIMPRHNPYEKSLEIADYVSSYFPPRWPDVVIAYEGNTTSKDKKETKSPANRPPYIYQVPLGFIPGVGGKTIEKLLDTFETEMNILHKLSKDDIEAVVGEKVANSIEKARKGQAKVQSGRGGNYGKIL